MSNFDARVKFAMGFMPRKSFVVTTNADKNIVAFCWGARPDGSCTVHIYTLEEIEEIAAAMCFKADKDVDFVFENREKAEKFYKELV